jgi:chromosome segregation ATPase
MQVTEMKTKLEEKIKALEEEKRTLLEERDKLKEILVLSEKAKTLESEVSKLKEEIKSLRDKIPEDILEELGKTVPKILESEGEKEEEGEECYQEEELF